MCPCGDGKKKLAESMKRKKEAYKRMYCSRWAWFYILTYGGYGIFLKMATLTSGFASPTCQPPDPQQQDPQPQSCVPGTTYLVVYPDAGSWKGPLIIAYIGMFIGLPKIGPAAIMQERVTHNYKADKAAVEMQAMDRA
jgi:hypothetical protein